MKAIILAITCSLFSMLVSCRGKQCPVDTTTSDEDTNYDDFDELCGLSPYLNSVAGHKEEELIVGNFTGHGIDTLYVVTEEIDSIDNMYDRYKFYAKSNNPDLPTIEIFGCGYATPMLVYEGDVDGDGKDEWGYLHTWLNSQWRQYRIYNYDSNRKEWRFLYYDTDPHDGIHLLHTSEGFRASGVDIVEKGPAPGLIKINYETNDEDYQYYVMDTIVKPTYTPISEDFQ
ncbi:MAG: hypothetical protein K2H61_01540 [Muribaculaceae bacterium]|nr:hypothetical protein [Muribaculaceae bacterium]